MRFSLRHLQIFVATARTGNISAAATELAMSQSAAHGCDCRLFETAPSGVEARNFVSAP